MAILPTTVPASPLNSSDGIALTFTADTDAEVISTALDNMPADFATMDAGVQLQANLRVTNRTDDTYGLLVRITKATGGTILAAATAGGAYETVEAGITNAAYHNPGAVTFTYVNTTATKADWDDAQVDLQQTYAKTKGNDVGYVEVDQVVVDGTYTAESFDRSGTAATTAATGTTATATKDTDGTGTATSATGTTATGAAFERAILAISATNPGVDTDHVVETRAKGTGVTLRMYLYQGTTQIDTWTHTLTATFADYSRAVPEASAANITDYTALRIHIIEESTSAALQVSRVRIGLPAVVGYDFSGTATTTAATGTTATGEKATTGTGTSTAASASVATGQKNASDAATTSAATGTTATGATVELHSGTASTTAATGSTATGQKGGEDAGVTSAASGITSTGDKGGAGSATDSAASGTTATGDKGALGAGTSTAAEGTTGTGSTARSGSASTTAATGTTATGGSAEAHAGTGSTTATTAATAQGVASKSGSGTNSALPTTTSSGQKDASGVASTSAAATTTATGTQAEAHAGTASTSATTGTSASGLKNINATASTSAATDSTSTGDKAGQGSPLIATVTGATATALKAALGTANITGIITTTGTGVATSASDVRSGTALTSVIAATTAVGWKDIGFQNPIDFAVTTRGIDPALVKHYAQKKARRSRHRPRPRRGGR